MQYVIIENNNWLGYAPQLLNNITVVLITPLDSKYSFTQNALIFMLHRKFLLAHNIFEYLQESSI